MNYKDDPWDWTAQIPQAAPLSNQVTPGQATPAQVTQGQPGIIDGFVKPMATQKAVGQAEKRIISPLMDTVGADMNALGAGITGDMSAANVGNSIAANMTADPMTSLLASNGAYGTAAPLGEAALATGASEAALAGTAASTAGTTAAVAAPLAAEAAGGTALAATTAANVWNPIGWAAGIYGAGKLLKIW